VSRVPRVGGPVNIVRHNWHAPYARRVRHFRLGLCKIPRKSVKIHQKRCVSNHREKCVNGTQTSATPSGTLRVVPFMGVPVPLPKSVDIFWSSKLLSRFLGTTLEIFLRSQCVRVPSPLVGLSPLRTLDHRGHPRVDQSHHIRRVEPCD
jgi:hypothetical protein